MSARPVSTLTLTQSGFTPDQARALATTIECTAAGAVDDLRHDLEGWHIYLSFYLLIQIGIVLLTMLLVQAVREPEHQAMTGFTARQTGQMSLPKSAIPGESTVNLARFVTSQA